MKDKELHELLDKEQWSDIIEKQSRQVRWLYNNSNKCTQVVDEKIVRLIVYKMQNEINELRDQLNL